MKIKLYKDSEFEIALGNVTNLLNSISRYIEFENGIKDIVLEEDIIGPLAYEKLPNEIKGESNAYILILILTNKKYFNNHFFDTKSNIYIISFSDWTTLTSVSKPNGIVFFIASILCDELGIGQVHYETTGCINDFWINKANIDVGMRSAYICNSCKKEFIQRTPNKIQEQVLIDVGSYLDLVSDFSRKNRDISEVRVVDLSGKAQSLFDVFLCHNNVDKPVIRQISSRLKKMGIKVWLDEEQIKPGDLWQIVLEKNIENIKSVAVFVGQSDIGPWQEMEIRGFLSEFVKRSCTVIPVILKSCVDVPELPVFLRQMMWVDMRKSEPDPYIQLKWGITGNR